MRKETEEVPAAVQYQDKTDMAYTGIWRVARCASLTVSVSFLHHARVAHRTHAGS